MKTEPIWLHHRFPLFEFLRVTSWAGPSLVLLAILPFFLLVNGCIFYKTDPNAKRATEIDAVQATPDYWWNKPASQHASGPDFETLWSACKAELYVRLFPLDREQYRDGLITSQPVVSAQFFEPWRADALTVHDSVESSVATIRRTVHIEVTRKPDGTYEASPKVLVERWANTERRLTSITQYHSAFSGGAIYDPADQSGAVATAAYWYALRRDPDLEKAMAASIRHRLGQ